MTQLSVAAVAPGDHLPSLGEGQCVLVAAPDSPEPVTRINGFLSPRNQGPVFSQTP